MTVKSFIQTLLSGAVARDEEETGTSHFIANGNEPLIPAYDWQPEKADEVAETKRRADEALSTADRLAELAKADAEAKLAAMPTDERFFKNIKALLSRYSNERTAILATIAAEQVKLASVELAIKGAKAALTVGTAYADPKPWPVPPAPSAEPPFTYKPGALVEAITSAPSQATWGEQRCNMPPAEPPVLNEEQRFNKEHGRDLWRSVEFDELMKWRKLQEAVSPDVDALENTALTALQDAFDEAHTGPVEHVPVKPPAPHSAAAMAERNAKKVLKSKQTNLRNGMPE